MLDNILGKILNFGALILIAGNPGAGKTLLASTICYANASNGIPCLYVSQQETKEVFFRHMKDFNMDFNELESRDLFKYYRVPIIIDPELINTLINELSTYSSKYKVLVIDSFTSLSAMIEENSKTRALLQNFFYNLAKLEKTLVVLVAEIPIGKESLNLGGIEFVSDVVLLLRQHVVRGLITRFIEVRKAREAPLSIGEIPFKIVDGVGIRSFIPPQLEELPPSIRGISYEYPCRELNEILRPVTAGSTTYVVMSADARSTETYIPGLIALSLALKHKLKTLVIDYYARPSITYSIIEYASKKSPRSYEVIKKLINELVETYYVNPATMSLEELYTYEIELVRLHQPKLLIFNRIDISSRIHGVEKPEKYFTYLWNELLWFRKHGVTVTRISTYINKEEYSWNASVSETVVRLFKTGKEPNLKIYLWTERRNPKILEFQVLSKCLDEFIYSV
ncbi:MAG: ATPase domain-containing protein [Desulfurococcaceae archaeon TW002]